MLPAAKLKFSPRWLHCLPLAVVVGIGAWTRASGFSHGDPWFDDAWVTLSSKVPFGTAMHMVNTTPLFTLGIRSWILLHPGALWWDQIPIFVLGLLTIVAVACLLRYFKMWWPLTLLGALIVAVSPVAVDYSTHIKQYNLDLLLACAVMWLFERWRREPSRQRAIVLAAWAALGLLISASTVVIVAPICLVVIHAQFVDRRRRIDAAIVVGTVASIWILEYLVWVRHLSNGLDVGWTNRGYMLTFKSLHKFVFALETMGSQLFHFMIGIPTGHPPDPSKQITSAGITIAMLSAVALAVVTVPAVVRVLRHPRDLAGPLVVPAIAVMFAIFLGIVAIAPFGDGRTDEVFYPALLLLFAGLMTKLHDRRSVRISRLLAAGVIVAAASCLLVGDRNRSEYPTIDLRGVYSQFHPHTNGYEFVVVDPWLTFTWADLGLSKTSVSFQHTFFDWSQGFHVVSNDTKVIISDQYFFPSGGYKGLSHYLHDLWYVGEAGSINWPRPSAADQLYQTRNYLALLAAGWTPTKTVFRSTHTVAILMHYSPPVVAPTK